MKRDINKKNNTNTDNNDCNCGKTVRVTSPVRKNSSVIKKKIRKR